jgi:hypothetical protein
MRWPPFRILVLRPSGGVALGFALGKLLHMTLAADSRIGHPQLGLVLAMIFVNAHMAVDACHLLEGLSFSRPIDRRFCSTSVSKLFL